MINLSPAEEMGLGGLGLDSRVRRLFYTLPAATTVLLTDRLAREAERRGLVYLHDGAAEPVRILLRPICVMPEQLSYVHHVCLTILNALKRIPDLYLEDPAARAILPLSPGEEQWLKESWGPSQQQNNPVFGRLDATAEFTSPLWKESLRFLEPNLCGVGGIYFAPACEELLCEVILPVIRERDPALQLERGHDLRDLLMQEVLEHLRAIGRQGRTLCFIEPKYAGCGPEEQEHLTRYYHERYGMLVLHADPAELELSPVSGEVTYNGQVVDIAYRDYEVRDLLALEAAGTSVDAVRALFRQNRIISSVGGDFDHKSCWELLTDPELTQRHFSAEERHLFQRHVLWTRVLSDRCTSLPDGGQGALLEYVRRGREHLVLKPNRSYGGEGVMLGPAVEQAEWEAAMEGALGGPEPWVVQRIANLPVNEFPVVEGGAVHIEPFYTVMGFAATEDGVGILCRASQRQVVNVAQRGGLSAVLVGRPLARAAPLSFPSQDLGPPAAPVQAPAPQAVQRCAGLLLRAQEICDLDGIIGLLGWDEETYAPDQGRGPRGRQLALLEGLRHQRLVDPALGELLDELGAAGPQDPVQAALLVRLSRLRERALLVPEELVRALAEARSRALAAWEEARRQCRYELYCAPLQAVLALTRERAAALAGGGDLYDALLEEHEPGMTRALLEPVLGELRAGLQRLVPAIAERQRARGDLGAGLPGPFPEAAQWQFTERLLADLGFDRGRGRQDRSTHPFTQVCSEHDVRLTTHLDEGDLLRGLLATAHEAGHGLYDQGVAAVLHCTPLAEGASLGLHESQSRLWENHVARSRAFWRCYRPVLAAAFPQLGALDAEGLYRAVTVVRPGPIRVSADEVTYNLHILFRYELELALLRGDLLPPELPGAWREAARAYLGPEGVPGPGDDVSGCMQDVHWALGSLAYFPTYTIGNLYAAQLMETYEGQVQDPWGDIERGDFLKLLGWMRDRVHRHGHTRSADQIVRAACGQGLSVGPFLRYLQGKYLEE